MGYIKEVSRDIKGEVPCPFEPFVKYKVFHATSESSLDEGIPLLIQK